MFLEIVTLVVPVSNSQITNNNVGGNGGLLLLFDSFINLDIISVDFINNDGEYLLKSSVSNDITIDTVDINSNDIQYEIINILANDGAFSMQTTNITNSNNNDIDSIASLVNITCIGSVSLTSVNINDSKSVQYLIFDQSTLVGDFDMTNVEIIDNINTDSNNNNILIQANNFNNANLVNTKFINNNEGTVLLSSVLDGNIVLTNV